MSPNGEILHNSSAHSHNNFLGNTGDALCREPQIQPAHRNHFAFCYQEGQFHVNKKMTTEQLVDLNKELTQNNITQRVRL